MGRAVALVVGVTCLGACALVTSLDDLGGGADAAFDTSVDAIPDGGSSMDASDASDGTFIPQLLCGTSQCDPFTQLCCTSGVQTFCTQTCAGPDWAFGCDDTRQCVARHDSGTNWACCLQPLDSGSNAASLCGQGCARAVCNPTAPDCPNGTTCSASETVDNYTLHYCQ